MEEYWESYAKLVDGHKARVSFNAGVADEVPNAEFLYVGFVKVKLKNPDADGLLTQDEVDEIGFIEDRIEMESLRWRSGKYMGRIVSNGEVNFIYYLKLDFEWSNTVYSAMQEFSEYKYEYGSRMDMKWEVYQKLLFPTIKEWQIIANHHSCDSLKEQGDTLTTPRAIEHKAYFYSQEMREKFITQIEKDGYTKQKDTQKVFRDRDIYGVEFYKKDSIFYYDIDEITLNLIEIAQSYDGAYDGWECALVK